MTAAALRVTASNASRAYGVTNPVFTGTITGLQNNDNITANYATTATVSSPVGNYPITSTLVDSGGKLANYTISNTNGTLNVTAAALSVTASNASRAYGMPNPPLTGIVIGIQNGDNITATYSTTATPTSSVGTYPIMPALGDPDHKTSNYTITSNNGVLTVTNSSVPIILSIAPAGAGKMVITWAAVSNSVYRVQYKASLAGTNWVSLAPDVVAASETASFSDQPAGAAQRFYRILFVASAPPVVPVIQSIAGAGTPNVVITWSAVSNQVYRVQYKPTLSGASWFNLAPDVTATNSTASFTDHPDTGTQRYYRVVLLSTVTPLTPLVVVANSASRDYGATNPVFGGTITGVQNGDNITATYTTTATTSSPAGAYPITPSLADPNGKLDNYLVSMTNGTLSVTTALLTVAATNASRPYGADNPTFTGTIVGIQNGDNITASYGTTATASSPVGPYPITPSLVDPGNKLSRYAVSITNGTLLVAQAALTVTANDASRAYGAANPTFAGTIMGIQNGDNLTASYATTATNSSPAGTYPIVPILQAPGAELSNYAVTLNNGTLTVMPATAPTLLSVARSGDTNVVITWASVSNSVYRVQYKTSPASAGWTDLTPDVTPAANTASFTDHPGTDPQRLYRVVLLPGF